MEGLPDMGAVGWVHYRLGGGWKALVVLGVGYMVLVGGAAALTSQIDTTRWVEHTEGVDVCMPGVARPEPLAGGAVPGLAGPDA